MHHLMYKRLTKMITHTRLCYFFLMLNRGKVCSNIFMGDKHPTSNFLPTNINIKSLPEVFPESLGPEGPETTVYQYYM